jgi:Fur family ferric uptake transcriptional regulator
METQTKLLKTSDPSREPGFCKRVIRDLGLKVTQQRLVILEEILGGDNHVTAQDVYERVAFRFPEIGFATVYRFLRTLSEQGYVTELRMRGLPARYEWAQKQHHDHMTCTGCGLISEFENDQIEALQQKIARNLGFVLTDHVLELYGVCEKCQNSGNAEPIRRLPGANLPKLNN